MKIYLTTALLALAISTVFGDISQVKKDISEIDAAVEDLSSQLKSDDLNYITALGIHNSAQDLDGKIKTATTDVNDTKEDASESDAKEIINTLTGTEKTVETIADRLVTLQPKFASLGVSGLAKDDINQLSTDVDAFGKALVSKTPSSQKETAQEL